MTRNNFEEEFHALDEVGTDQSHNAAKKKANKQKNRFRNIYPYDHCRVVLGNASKDQSNNLPSTSSSKDRGGGYINASFMPGINGENAFIATQGPLPHTFGDFWQMIWEQNCYVIVMLTHLVEAGQIKCDQYWPNINRIQNMGAFAVQTISEVERSTFTDRSLILQQASGAAIRKIRQYQYTVWPDQGVPTDIHSFLDLVQHARMINEESSPGFPVVVHCSDGVSRTGTFIVIDYLMQALSIDDQVDIFGAVGKMRKYRPKTVQTLEQYQFIYQAMVRVQHRINICNEAKEQLWQKMQQNHAASVFPSRPIQLDQLEHTLEQMTAQDIEEEYLAVEAVGANLICDVARLEANKKKNRYGNICPYDHTRVPLGIAPENQSDNLPSTSTSTSTNLGTGYINASFIPGPNKRHAYIATQGPLPNTIEDFWQMIWEQNCSVIVMLTNLVEAGRTKCHQYWPSDFCVQHQGDLRLSLVAEKEGKHCTTRSLYLQKASEGSALKIYQYQYTVWPDKSAPTDLDGFLDFVQFVRKKCVKYSVDGPVVVHCSAGIGRAGTFIAIDYLMQAILNDDQVDVSGVVGEMRLHRMKMVQTQDQYWFVYKAIEEGVRRMKAKAMEQDGMEEDHQSTDEDDIEENQQNALAARVEP